MAELECIDKVIRATAEEFGHCPGWTKLLAEALTELYETRHKLSTQVQPRRKTMIEAKEHIKPTEDDKSGLHLITKHTANPTVESLTERIDVLEGFIIEWMARITALQRDMLNTARDSNNNVLRILDAIEGKVTPPQQLM